jgi:hypothetical protein
MTPQHFERQPPAVPRPLRRWAARLTRKQHREEGASLLLALIFVIGIGLVVGSLLTYAGAGISSANKTLIADQSGYDAGGALQTAINAVRNSSYDDPDTACLGTGYLDVPLGNGGTASAGQGGTARIYCQGGAGTGAAAGLVPITNSNKPGSALLTLGTLASGEDGLRLESNGSLTVKGQIRDNSAIQHGGAHSTITLVGASTAEAVGGCNGVVFNPGTAGTCDVTPSGPDAATFLDPITVPATATAYAPPPTAVGNLVYRSVPSACSALVTLDPGYYDDASALSHLTNGCPTITVWFKPGQYYFDFHNLEGAQGLTQGPDLWTIGGNATVVAGTPSGWTTSPFTAPSVPGACISPLTSTMPNLGVQFAFGGDSRVLVNGGELEICGQYHSNRPSLAVYGITSGNNPSPSSPILTTTGDGSTPGGDVPFTTTPAPSPAWSALKAQDCTIGSGTCATSSIASATMTSGSPRAGVVVTGFGTSGIPAGSYVSPTATLLITHRESTKSTKLSLTASGTIDTGGATPMSFSGMGFSSSTTYQTTTSLTLTLTPAVLKDIRMGASVLSNLKVEAAISNPLSGATMDIDAVRLQVTYTPPAVRGESTKIAGVNNCITVVPYGASGSCPLIQTSGNGTGLYLQGTTYAPAAALDIQLTNVAAQVFRAGLITRSLTANITASSKFAGAVIEVPDNALGGSLAPLDVYFTAYVCPPDADCTGVSPPNSPWRLGGQAVASFADSGGSVTPGSRVVTIRSWNLPR